MAIKISFVYTIILFFSFFQSVVYSQTITPKKGSFGVDKNNKIIVWHESNLDSILKQNNNNSTITFNNNFNIAAASTISYTEKTKLTYNNEEYSLYVTKLPVIHINTKDSIKDDVKLPGNLTYFKNDLLINSLIGVELRGNISLSFPKKNYDIETWSDATSKESKDVKFKGLRNDDDWILDALYNEPLRIRSVFSLRLWQTIYKPDYLDKEPKAKSTVSTKFVEVFKNDSYLGVYALMESVDRKLLKLKKNNGPEIFGELFKASSYEGAPSFTKAPEYKNIFPHWAGFEMRYPIIDYNSHWENVHAFVDLVANGSDADFTSKISQHVNIGNVIDYYLLMNMLRATDNFGKNYYLGKYDKNTPYFFVAWDLDGVMGSNPEGKRAPKTNDIFSNHLFDRLIEVNPDNYKEKLKSRWALLRTSELKTDALLGKIDKMYNKFLENKIYEREQLIWKFTYSIEEQHSYLKEWITDRVNYLDTYFKEL